MNMFNPHELRAATGGDAQLNVRRELPSAIRPAAMDEKGLGILCGRGVPPWVERVPRLVRDPLRQWISTRIRSACAARLRGRHTMEKGSEPMSADKRSAKQY
jgi:hypothetical protein